VCIGEFLRLFFVTALSIAVLKAAGADWPQNYIVHKNSASPDGRYAVLVLSKEAAIDQDQTQANTTYLADLQTRQTIGDIRETDYFEGQNHRDLTVDWAPDSTACVLDYDGRYGFDSVFVLELQADSFRQIDIGRHIQKTLARLFDGNVNGYFRFGPDHKLKVRALSYTNPKLLPGQPSNYAMFQGTFDLKGDKWSTSSARKMNSEQDYALVTAYDDNFAKHMTFTGWSMIFGSEEEQKADALDKTMNEVYRAVRSILSPDRFAKVKEEQIAWEKTRDAAHSAEEKSKLTENRIRAYKICFGDVNPSRSSRAASLTYRACVFPLKFSA
jgi:hypothetical protein